VELSILRIRDRPLRSSRRRDRVAVGQDEVLPLWRNAATDHAPIASLLRVRDVKTFASVAL
jgi:hypothetical protein